MRHNLTIEPIKQQAVTVEQTAILLDRRYDVDWLRTLAMGLLIVYHVAITFQPFAFLVGFIQNEQSLEGIWVLMGLINIWRIPILFLISGMGVRFAMRRRDWKALLKDRTLRILLPFVFGIFFVAPINTWFATLWYGEQGIYIPNAGHLWFLGNIFVYVLLLMPLFYFWKNRPNSPTLTHLRTLIRQPLAIFLFALPLIAEALLVNPDNYPSYANTAHGFWLGLVCFLIGYLFITLGDDFWQAVTRQRWIALAVATGLFFVRFFQFNLDGYNGLIAVESLCWMLAVIGFAALYLNRPSSALRYLSVAVYPVYIVHLPMQYALSYLIVPLALPATIKLILLLVGTLGGSLLLYEVVLKRAGWFRPLFGMKRG